jgi:hypothetical protein
LQFLKTRQAALKFTREVIALFNKFDGVKACEILLLEFFQNSFLDWAGM